MRAAIYARVSTAEQQTIPLQLEGMRAYCKDRKWTVTVEVEDIGSGAKRRPKREELLKAARQRKIDTIIVWRLDRWGRSVTDVIGSISELGSLGVGFVSLTEALDFTTPTGRAMVGLLAVFAEFERDIHRARITAGIEAAKKRGVLFGRPHTASLKTEEIRALRSKGLNVSEVARRLKIGRASVRRAMA